METENKFPMRVNRYISAAGVCSRRAADRIIALGRVTVNGKIASLGDRVSFGDAVTVDGRPITLSSKKTTLLFYKPRGVIVTSEVRKGAVNVEQYLHYPIRVFPVGRLDKDSEGLLLLTNDGAMVNRLLKAKHAHEREYEVRVNKPLTKEFLQKMAAGVPVLDTVTLPAKVKRLGEKSFSIVLIQGLNRQIRRMCEALGYTVTRLLRVRIMHLRLGDLPPGKYRTLTKEEEKELYRRLAL